MSTTFVSSSNFNSSDFTFTCKSFVKMLSSTKSLWNPSAKSTFDNDSPLTNTFWKPSNNQTSTYLIRVLLILYSATVSNRMSCDITTNTVRSLDLLHFCGYLYQPNWNLIKKEYRICLTGPFQREKKDKPALMLTSINCMTVLQSFFNWIPLQLLMSLNLAYWYPVSSEISQQRSSLECISSLSSNEHSKI